MLFNRYIRVIAEIVESTMRSLAAIDRLFRDITRGIRSKLWIF